jgi:hypothetical protein
MADQSQSNNQQTIVYMLGAIAVLLIAIIIYLVFFWGPQSKSASVGGNASTAASDQAAQNIASQMPPAAQNVQFDPKTATKLPAGMTPDVALKTYMEDITHSQFAGAYALLPLAQKQSYVSADQYASTVKGYGITGYRLGKSQQSGSDVQIVSEQDTPAMNITYTWVYTKVGNDWYVKSRTMGGTVQ